MILQTPGVAMAQEHALLSCLQQGRVVDQVHPAALHERVTRQKVTVAAHEMHVHALRGLAQRIDTGALKHIGLVVERIITHPYFKQVAEDEERLRRGGVQILAPRFKGVRLLLAQMQVGDEVDAVPRSSIDGRQRCDRRRS